MEENFFKDLKGGISGVVGTLLYGQNVAEIAKYLKLSPSTIYAWANPGQIQIPNMEQLYKCFEYVASRNPTAYRRAAQMMMSPLGFQAVSDEWIKKAEELKALASELQGGPSKKEVLQTPPQQGPLFRPTMEQVQ